MSDALLRQALTSAAELKQENEELRVDLEDARVEINRLERLYDERINSA